MNNARKVRGRFDVAIWCLFLVLIATLILSVASNPRAALQIEGSSTVAVDQVTHALPPILDDEAAIVHHEFAISNTSNHTLNIRDVKKSCTCTEVEIGTRVLNAGETTTLAVSVDLRGRTGRFAADCWLVDDSGTSTRYRLQVTIHPRVQFEPAFLQLGTITPGQEVTSRFRVYSRGHGLPSDLKLIPRPDSMGVDEISTRMIDLGDGISERQTECVLKLKAPALAGIGSGEISAEMGSERKAQSLVNWIVDELYLVAPKRIFFASKEAGARAFRTTVSIRRHDGAAFQIKDILPSSSAISCSCSSMRTASPEHQIEVIVDEASFSGFLLGTVTINTDCSEGLQLRIPVAASR